MPGAKSVAHCRLRSAYRRDEVAYDTGPAFCAAMTNLSLDSGNSPGFSPLTGSHHRGERGHERR